MVLAGFALGILGYMSTTRWLVAAGIALIVLGALLFPIAINLTESTPPEVHNPALARAGWQIGCRTIPTRSRPRRRTTF